jgi:hypothetical protein
VRRQRAAVVMVIGLLQESEIVRAFTVPRMNDVGGCSATDGRLSGLRPGDPEGATK